jgi:hypothetical protein
VALTGHDFQNDIYNWLIENIHHDNVSILQPKKLKPILPNRRQPPNKFFCLQLHTPIGSIIGDTDIVVFDRAAKKPIIIISCKRSIRERLTESLYYKGLYERMYGIRLPLFVVTDDPDLEFGTGEKPKKARILATFENTFVYSTNPETEVSGCVKFIDSLINDVRRVAAI